MIDLTSYPLIKTSTFVLNEKDLFMREFSLNILRLDVESNGIRSVAFDSKKNLDFH